MNNQRGSILSKLFIIPISVALMVGFFFLGYYVGKYQSKSGSPSELMPSLPDVVSQNIPKKEEFTFYKTLTDKGDKTVSIDLNPKKELAETKAEKKQVAVELPKTQAEKKPAVAEAPKKKSAPPAPKEKQLEIKIEKPTQPKQTASKQAQPAPKKEAAAPASNVRYSVQIASYPDKEGANSEVKKLKQGGFAAFLVAAELPGKGTWYRVRVGSLTKKAAAEKLQKDIQAKAGLASIIVTTE